jgi:signal transduction histidine kinase/ActR/RegA family two-component response regulator
MTTTPTTPSIRTLTGSTPSVDAPIVDLTGDQVLRERVDADLAARSYSGSFFYVVAAAILLLAADIDPHKEIAFALGSLILSGLRAAITFRRRPGWRRAFSLLTIGIALLWGELGAVVVFTRGIDQTVLLVLLCHAGISAAAMVALSPARRLQLVYGLALAVPTLVMLAFQPLTATLGGILLLQACYLGYMLVQGGRLHAEYTKALATARRLELVNQEIEAASRAKSHFLADMSHELRTPMTAIRGFSDLLLDSELDEADREYVQTILRNSDHLLAIINDILDLARVEAGRMKIESASTSPARIALDVEALLGERAATRGLTLAVRVDGVVPAHIQSDQLRIRQILINLASNAIRHTERGGVTVTLGVDHPDAREPRLVFKVSDSGVGMSADQLARLFQPFAQVDHSAERRAGGTGLGLVISQKLAAALGGIIEISSQPGQGTVATFSLPTGPLAGVPLWRTLRGGTGTEGGDAMAGGPQLRGRVLVAEDDEDNRQLIRTQLERAGASVEVAGDGATATRQAMAADVEGRPFAVVLMDMRMPEMDGYAATRALREAGYRRPIVALTAQAMTGDREKCLAAGCDDFLVKPIEGRQLLEALRAYDAAPDKRP